MDVTPTQPEEETPPAEYRARMIWEIARKEDPTKPMKHAHGYLVRAASAGDLVTLKLLLEKDTVDLTKRSGHIAVMEAIDADMYPTARHLWLAGAEALVNRVAQGPPSVEWIRPYIERGPLPRANHGFAEAGSSTLYVACGQTRLPKTDFKKILTAQSEESIHSELVDFWRLNLNKTEPIDWHSLQDRSRTSTFLLDPATAGPNITLDETKLLLNYCASIDTTCSIAPVEIIKATAPFLPSDGISYYEFTLLEIEDGSVGIGVFGSPPEGVFQAHTSLDESKQRYLQPLITPTTTTKDMPGWKQHTFGYHSDDGRCFCAVDGIERRLNWAARYEPGDTVGCGIVWNTREVFFTRNGVFIGVASHNVDLDSYYPTIGIHAAKTRVKANFGADPFMFNLKVDRLKWEALAPPPLEFPARSPHTLLSNTKHLFLISRAPLRQSIRIYSLDESKWLETKVSSKFTIPDSYTPSEFASYTISDTTIYCYDPVGLKTPCQTRTRSARLWCWRISRALSLDYVPMVPSAEVLETLHEDGAPAAIPEKPLKFKYHVVDPQQAQSSSERRESIYASCDWNAIVKELNAMPTEAKEEDDSSESADCLVYPYEAEGARDAFVLEESPAVPDPEDNTSFDLSNPTLHSSMTDLFSTARIFQSEGERLAFVGPTGFGMIHLNEKKLYWKESWNQPPSSLHSAYCPYSKHSITVFGGDEPVGLHHFSLNASAWYLGYNHGVVTPSSREAARATSLFLTVNSPLLRQCVPPSRPYRLQSVFCTALYGGMHEGAFSSDFELLVCRNPETDYYGLTAWTTNETDPDTKPLTVARLDVTDPSTGALRTYFAHLIILAARSSRIRQLAQAYDGTQRLVIAMTADHYLAGQMLSFLHDDFATSNLNPDTTRDYYQLFLDWAPEHENRICEGLLMERLYLPGTWHTDILYAFDNSFCSDITIRFEPRPDSQNGLSPASSMVGITLQSPHENSKSEMRAHRCLLGRHNRYFGRLFASRIEESLTPVIVVHASNHVGYALIKSIYTGRAELDGMDDHLEELLELADKYFVLRLKATVEETLAASVGMDNILRFMPLAREHEASILLDACCRFLEQNQLLETSDVQGCLPIYRAWKTAQPKI